VKAKLIAVGETTLRRVGPGAGCFDHPALRRCCLFDEVIFTIAVPLVSLLVDGDDLLAVRQEVRSVVAEPVDHVGEAEAAIFDEGASLADVAPLLEVLATVSTRESRLAGTGKVRLLTEVNEALGGAAAGEALEDHAGLLVPLGELGGGAGVVAALCLRNSVLRGGPFPRSAGAPMPSL
jgi:hypothetical protein